MISWTNNTSAKESGDHRDGSIPQFWLKSRLIIKNLNL